MVFYTGNCWCLNIKNLDLVSLGILKKSSFVMMIMPWEIKTETSILTEY